MKSCAFLFPGQGAQYVGMGLDLVNRFSGCADLLQRAEAYLKMPLGEIMFYGPKERLDEDFTAQVAVYTVSSMVVDVLESHAIRARAIAPYSSGLYAAAYAAGSVDFETGLALMREADKCIRKQGVRGGMGVVLGLSASEVEQLCGNLPGVVEVSIVNTRHQTIVSGDSTGVDDLLQRAIAAEALRTDRLPACAPYHCSLLEAADRCLAGIVSKTHINSPHTPLISYIDCNPIEDAPKMAEMFSSQLSNPVQWVGVVEELVRLESDPMVEIGPGRMLGRSVRWIHRRANVLHTETADDLEGVLSFLVT